MKMYDPVCKISVTLSELVDLIDACKITHNDAVENNCPLCAKLYAELCMKLQRQNAEIRRQIDLADMGLNDDPERGDR